VRVAKKLAAPARTGLRATESELATPPRSWLIEGERESEADKFSRKAAAPPSVGVSAVETEFVTPAIPWSIDEESDKVIALPIPARDWLIAGERETDAESELMKAAIAPKVGFRATETELATPEMSWSIEGVKEIDCVRVARNAATDER